MSRLIGFVFILVLVGAVGGVGFLATWDMPAPTQTVEAVLPDDQFEK